MDQEFWEGEDLYYECIDTSLGVDANSSNFKMYKCIADKPLGRYNTPRVNHSYEEWPICQPKTTTVKPGIVEMGFNLFTLYSLKISKNIYFCFFPSKEIKRALKVLLNNAIMELEKALAEKNYFLNVTLPAFMGKI